MSVQISVRIDEDTKVNFERLCADLGLSVSAAFNIFAKKMIRENGFPFDVAIAETTDAWAERNKTRILRASDDMRAGKGVRADIDAAGNIVRVDI
jgi:DNA-damage-inducible protein J